jgi:hypothetical protein
MFNSFIKPSLISYGYDLTYKYFCAFVITDIRRGCQVKISFLKRLVFEILVWRKDIRGLKMFSFQSR